MDVELFDVVDENDQVIGVLPRDVVHRDNLMHRAIHVLVFRGDGSLLIQKRSMSKDNNPGLWDSSVGGHVNSNEAYDDCAVREIGEELGIFDAGRPERLFKISACQETGFEHIWVYRLEWDGAINHDPVEIDELRWLSPDELIGELASSHGVYSPSLRLILQAARDQGLRFSTSPLW